MKVELRKHVTYVDTLMSPYYGETGTHKRENVHAHCGNCGADIEEAHFYHSWSYCPYCGEKLDWPEDEKRKRNSL